MYSHDEFFKFDNFRMFKRNEWKRIDRKHQMLKRVGVPVVDDVFLE